MCDILVALSVYLCLSDNVGVLALCGVQDLVKVCLSLFIGRYSLADLHVLAVRRLVELELELALRIQTSDLHLSAGCIHHLLLYAEYDLSGLVIIAYVHIHYVGITDRLSVHSDLLRDFAEAVICQSNRYHMLCLIIGDTGIRALLLLDVVGIGLPCIRQTVVYLIEYSRAR